MTLNSESNFIQKNENISRYLNDIRGIELISMDEEIDLVMKAKNGDIESRNKLFSANQCFLFAVAKRYATNWRVLELIDEAIFGFNTAIEKFDPTRGLRLLTYAVNYIKRDMSAFINRKDRLVRKTNDVKTAFFSERVKNKFFCINGRFPSEEELVDMLSKEFNKSVNKMDVYDVVIESVDSMIGSGDTELPYMESNEFSIRTANRNMYEIEMDREEIRGTIEKYLSVLNERDRTILKMLYGIGYEEEATQEDVAEAMGISKERVRQLSTAAIMKIQKAFKVEKAK